MEECEKAFEYIKHLLINQLVLHMLTVNNTFRLESGTNKTAAGGTLFQLQQDQLVLMVTVQRNYDKHFKLMESQNKN